MATGKSYCKKDNPGPYRHPVVALTGGIACGKSTVAGYLAGLGWHVVNSDHLAHEVMQPDGAAYKNVVDEFGAGILNDDGSINRALLGKIIFNDASQRQRLNEITHPLIRSVWQNRIHSHLQLTPSIPVVLEIPLLFEVGLADSFHHKWAVACGAETQLARMAARGWDREECMKRLASQWSIRKKMESSDVVVWNDGSLELLKDQLAKIAGAFQMP